MLSMGGKAKGQPGLREGCHVLTLRRSKTFQRTKALTPPALPALSLKLE